MRSILSRTTGRSVAASNSANFTVEEPPLIVRMEVSPGIVFCGTDATPVFRPGPSLRNGEFSLGFDRQQPVIFCQTLGLADRSDLDLIAGPPDGQVREPIIFRLAA